MPALLLLILLQDPTLEQKIEEAVKKDTATQKTDVEQPAPPPAQRGGAASLLNPAIAVIFDAAFGLYGSPNVDFLAAGIPPAGDDPGATGFNLQEVELAFQAAIDPYFEGTVILAIPNLEGLEVEEAFFVTTSLPGNLQLKSGIFRSQVGRNNAQHLHQQHFTRRPLMTPLLFGTDGLRAPGAQIEWWRHTTEASIRLRIRSALTYSNCITRATCALCTPVPCPRIGAR